ncbi:MAG: PD-(D/E)XK nuclease family protein [Actinobacteria bacterium]|nr:PD-(D/E)XK nuclease family protein [Actinomycetota bacterium]
MEERATGSWEVVEIPNAAALQDAVGARIADIRASDPLARVTLLVDNSSIGGLLRRQLIASGRCGPGITDLQLLTPLEFVSQLAQRCGVPGPDVTGSLVPTAVVQSVLNSDPGEFAAVKDHESTTLRLSTLLSQTRWCAVDDTAITEVRDVSGATAAAVVGFLERCRVKLRSIPDHSPVWDVVDSVRTALNAYPHLRAAAAAWLGPLVITAQQVPNPVRELLAILPVDARSVEFSLDPRRDPVPDGVLDCPDPGTEATLAIRDAARAIDAGVPPEQVAIAYPTNGPYARLVAAELESAGIAWHGSAHVSLSATTPARAVKVLLDMAQRAADADYPITRPLLMQWLGTGSIRLGGGQVRTKELRRFVRSESLHGSAATWPDVLHRRAAELKDDGTPTRAAESARQLLGVLSALEESVRGIAAGPTYGDLARATWEALESFHLRGRSWAADDSERLAVDHLRSLLTERITALDDLNPAPPTPAVLARLVDDDLGKQRTWRGHMGTGVYAGPIAETIGLHFTHVIVVGAAEGLLPPAAHEDALLPDSARRRLRRIPDDLAVSTDVIDRTAVAYRSLVGAAHSSLVTRPRGALPTGATRTPSRFLPTESGASSNIRVMSRRATFGDTRGLPQSGTSATPAHWPLPASDSDLAVAGLLRNPEEADEELARLAACERSALYASFDNHHGNLSSDGASPTWDITDRPLSATAIEEFLHCPHKFFVHRVLKFDTEEPSDDVDVIEPRHLGTVIHTALERLFTAAKEEGWLPGAGEPWPAQAAERLGALFAAEADAVRATGRTGWEPSWRASAELIAGTLPDFLDFDTAELRADPGLRPVAAELSFGRDGGSDVGLTLTSGTTVLLSGAIDRLDESADGLTLGVLDYKTGSSNRLAKALREDEREKVQDLVYDVAARQLHPDATQVVVRFAFLPNDGSPEAVHAPALDDRTAVLAEILDRMERAGLTGDFPPFPRGSRDFCPVCIRLGRRAMRAARDRESRAAVESIEGDRPGHRTGADR